MEEVAQYYHSRHVIGYTMEIPSPLHEDVFYFCWKQ
jgi:hypothetical protein